MKWSKNNIYESFIIIISAFSIGLNFYLFKDWRGILYYTILSNLLVFIFYSVVMIKRIRGTFKETDRYVKIKGLALISILCTMFIYYGFVSKNSSVYSGHPYISGAVHILIPVLVMLDCILFDKRKTLRYRDVILWIIPLMLYYGLINIYSLLGGRFLEGKKFPYEILDFGNYDIAQIILTCAGIIIFYSVMGIFIIFINRNTKEFKIGGKRKWINNHKKNI